MVSKSTVALVVVGIGVLCWSSWALADAAGDYEMLFGQEEKTAVAKGVYASAEFAGRLFNAAKSVGDAKDLQALLCEKAYEFGIKAPVGYPAAADAMKLLAEKMPGRKTEAREKLLKVQQLRYARSAAEDRKKIGLELVDMLAAFGDEKAKAGQEVEALAMYRRALTFATTWKSGRTGEIIDKIKQLAAAQESERRIAGLKARLEKDPKDAVARTALITTYLGELDEPAEAVKLLTVDLDEGLRTYVPLAAKNVADLDESACIQLAEWLLTVVEKSYPADKGVLLGKAQACCERYLEVHTTEDANRLKGKILLEKLKKGAAETRAAEAGPLPKGAVLVMTFDAPTIFRKDGESYVRDLSATGAHGKITAATLVEGKAGKALEFDGQQSIVTCPKAPALDIEGPFTVSAWIKGEARQNSTYPRIVTKFDYFQKAGFNIEVKRDGGTCIFEGFLTGAEAKGHAITPSSVLDSEWHHLLGRFDTKTIALFFDGKLAARNEANGRMRVAPQQLTIGNGFDGKFWFPFKGSIDEVIIFNRALTDQEIQHLYDMGKKGVSLPKP